MAQKTELPLPRSLDELHEWLRLQSESKRKPLTMIPAICHANPRRIFGDIPGVLLNDRGDLLTAEFLPEYKPAPNGARGQVEKKPGGRLFVVPSGELDIWWLVTAEKTAFVRRLQAVLQATRRYVTQFWFTNHELRILLEEVKARSECPGLTITASLRSMHGNTSTIREPYDCDAMFGLASDWAHSIKTLHVDCPGPRPFTFTLFREGSVRMGSASWDVFSRLIPPLVLKSICDKLASLEKRSRRSFEELGRPVEIRYPWDIFLGREQNLQVVNALQATGTHSVAVRHLNPYLHAVVVDLVDGGEVDVFVTSRKTLTVVPGYSSTYGSLLRVIGAVFDSVSEGGTVVENPAPSELTFADVMGATNP